ncbi:hypothetical protein [Frankia tisae]|nr:hypothetical protein [Frankia tisae]
MATSSPLGTVDESAIARAESLGIDEVATVDRAAVPAGARLAGDP